MSTDTDIRQMPEDFHPLVSVDKSGTITAAHGNFVITAHRDEIDNVRLALWQAAEIERLDLKT